MVILVCAFAAACFFKVNVIYIVLVCGAIGDGAVRILAKNGRNGENSNLFFSCFLKLFPDRPVQLRRGYAAMPLIQGQVVQGYGWLSMSEFTDLITLSQMTPGPIAVNSATFVGSKIAGIPGALAATFGCILPSCILVTLLAKLYLKYREMAMLQGILHSLRPAVVAMIGSAGISILVTAFWGSEGGTVIRLAQTNWSLVAIFIICLVLLRKGKKIPSL